MYITKLNNPITLLHISQCDSTRPLFQVRLLENSQIGLCSSGNRSAGAASSASSDETPPEELVCGAPDALIPHHQWVHFAVSCRQPKGASIGEARIYVNGVRVGAMRVPFPMASPPVAQAAASQSHAKPTIAADAIRISVGREHTIEGKKNSETKDASETMGRDGNEWMLGRALLVEDNIPEDVVLLMHHLVSFQSRIVSRR